MRQRRRCGIATFTTYTQTALLARNPALKIDTYAIDDGAVGDYLLTETALIRKNHRSDYRATAERIKQSGAQAVWIQHEFGIFGGEKGRIYYRIHKGAEATCSRHDAHSAGRAERDPAENLEPSDRKSCASDRYG